MRPWRARAALVLLLAACSGSDRTGGDAGPLARLAPTAPLPLSPGNAEGQDEDPSILVARSGEALWAAWYSNRAGLHASGRERKEIFVARSLDGLAWTDPPVQVTDGAEWSFYPSLAQGADGAFHLAWMRWQLSPPGCVGPPECTDYASHVVYNRSPDGLAWDTAAEVELSSGTRDELPSLVAASDGRLLAYFVSPGGDPVTNQIFVAVRDGAGWHAPQPVAGVNADTEHDTFPHVVERAPGSFLMAWTRWTPPPPPAQPNMLESGTTETWLSTSSDGLTWTTPVVASGPSPSTIDVFPFLYPDHARQSWSVLWTTQNGTVTRPVDAPDPAPLGTLDVPSGGYTVRVAPSPTPGIVWAAWAEFVDPEHPTTTQKIRQRFLAR